MQLLLSLKYILKYLFKWCAFVLSPPYCESCGIATTDRFIFCQDCYSKIKPIVTVQLQVTAKYSVKVFAISDYVFPLKKLILAKHISNRLAAEYLGLLSWQLSNIKYVEFDVIVPVPLHWSRRIKRGYNQTEVMAEAIAKNAGKPVVSALKRSKRTEFQFKLDVEEREENIKSCFKLTKKQEINIVGKNVLLVDDLMTSGATIKYAAQELLKANPKTITILVACRVV